MRTLTGQAQQPPWHQAQLTDFALQSDQPLVNRPLEPKTP